MVQPEIRLLDEPRGALEAMTMISIQEELAHLSEKTSSWKGVSAGAGVSRLQRGIHPCESGLFI
ncbi:hypothetical protein MES5069_310007 [Mesorhizobium escarrei]|uniref:Uncharacterized protein n=1 Tax=Mesorhizobium escarrei TaxID=666018 RepID=A0ABM9DZP9_9HYPH|nr:hypothetical protein MES5069_310007 [Mesorhizobium escarrei]